MYDDFLKLCPLPWTLDESRENILDANGLIVLSSTLYGVCELEGELVSWLEEYDIAAHPQSNPVARLRDVVNGATAEQQKLLGEVKERWPEMYWAIYKLILPIDGRRYRH